MQPVVKPPMNVAPAVDDGGQWLPGTMLGTLRPPPEAAGAGSSAQVALPQADLPPGAIVSAGSYLQAIRMAVAQRVTPATVGDIVATLAEQAKRGDPQSARVLQQFMPASTFGDPVVVVPELAQLVDEGASAQECLTGIAGAVLRGKLSVGVGEKLATIVGLLDKSGDVALFSQWMAAIKAGRDPIDALAEVDPALAEMARRRTVEGQGA